MRADVEDLFVQRRLADFAFVDVHDEAAVGAEEADDQRLRLAIPLAADHEAVAIAVGLRARDDRLDHGGSEAADAPQQVGDLFVLQLQLRRIGEVLILAAAALHVVAALRLDAVGRGCDDLEQFGARETFSAP